MKKTEANLGEKGVFLGKGGKVYGPFQKDEFDQMFADGTLSQYVWMWHWNTKSWKPIEAPPPPPPSGGIEKGMGCEEVQAICFDRFNLVSGKLECVTESGCELVSKVSETGMVFSLKSRAELRLLDQAKGKATISAPVVVANTERRGEFLVFRLMWNEIPRTL